MVDSRVRDFRVENLLIVQSTKDMKAWGFKQAPDILHQKFFKKFNKRTWKTTEAEKTTTKSVNSTHLGSCKSGSTLGLEQKNERFWLLVWSTIESPFILT